MSYTVTFFGRTFLACRTYHDVSSERMLRIVAAVVNRYPDAFVTPVFDDNACAIQTHSTHGPLTAVCYEKVSS